MESAIQLEREQQRKKKHPPGLYLLFFTEMWERFSYYGLRGLLTLYLTTALVSGGLGFSPHGHSLFTDFILEPVISHQ